MCLGSRRRLRRIVDQAHQPDAALDLIRIGLAAWGTAALNGAAGSETAVAAGTVPSTRQRTPPPPPSRLSPRLPGRGPGSGPWSCLSVADKDSSGGVGNRGFERRSGLRECRCRKNSAVHTTRNAAAPTATARVVPAAAFRMASTAIADARAASTVAMTVGVLARKRSQGRRPRASR